MLRSVGDSSAAHDTAAQTTPSACLVPGMEGSFTVGEGVRFCMKKTRQLKISGDKHVQYETWQSSGKFHNSCYSLRSLRWSGNPVLETSD